MSVSWGTAAPELERCARTARHSSETLRMTAMILAAILHAARRRGQLFEDFAQFAFHVFIVVKSFGLTVGIRRAPGAPVQHAQAVVRRYVGWVVLQRAFEKRNGFVRLVRRNENDGQTGLCI